MTDIWDMSFLVDQTSQIQDARGNLGRHFGVLQQVLAGKHLVNFVAAEDRLAFLRMMERLSQRASTETIAVGFKTPLSGERKLGMQARPGIGPTSWWLLLSDQGIERLTPIGEVENSTDMASEAEFGALARGAAGDQPNTLDLSVFRAALLADNQPSAVLSANKSAELDQRIGETLRETATGGIVTQPSRGEYALVHGRDVGVQAIADRITDAANAAGVPPATLGLAHHTQPLAEDMAAVEVRNLIRGMRNDLQTRTRAGRIQSLHAAGAHTTVPHKSSLLSTLKSMIGR